MEIIVQSLNLVENYSMFKLLKKLRYKILETNSHHFTKAARIYKKQDLINTSIKVNYPNLKTKSNRTVYTYLKLALIYFKIFRQGK